MQLKWSNSRKITVTNIVELFTFSIYTNIALKLCVKIKTILPIISIVSSNYKIIPVYYTRFTTIQFLNEENHKCTFK